MKNRHATLPPNVVTLPLGAVGNVFAEVPLMLTVRRLADGGVEVVEARFEAGKVDPERAREEVGVGRILDALAAEVAS